MINVICVKWGDRYDYSYVNRLEKMVAQNLSLPHTFYCYTDNPKNINSKTISMPDDGLELWWPKLRMFEKGFGGLEGECLFFDLDVVIQKNIDHLLDFKGFHWIQAHWKFNKTIGYESGMRQKEAFDMNCNSSCMRWRVGENEHIWNYFWNDPEYFMMKYVGIDRFMFHEGFGGSTFSEGIFYSRKHGIKHGDLPLIAPPWYNSEEHTVCLMNGMHKVTKELFNEWKPYEGYEKYYL